MKLNNEEIKAYVFKILISTTKQKPITASMICSLTKTKFSLNFYSTNLVRKIINEFRQEQLPVLATSNGYWLSYDKEDILAQIVSLQGRIAAQEAALQGLKYLIRTM